MRRWTGSSLVQITPNLSKNGAIIEDGKLVTDESDKYFVDVGASLSKFISPSKRKPDEYINFKASKYFYLTEVTENDINTIVGNSNIGNF